MNKTSRYTPDLIHAKQESLYYILTMFPYPSGYGLHVGHASIYTINDILARYKRMQGFSVLNPIGFDSFGLPTENYAMKLGKPAYEVTDANIDIFIQQLEALDMSFDMERTLVTSKPKYYKWTQRIFQQLYKAGLVYRDEMWVNRCPSCQTVLANDQVVEGECERCKSQINQKMMPQRFIKITAYADRLINDLDALDWPEETKTAQKNWIGKSNGAEITFMVKDKKVTVFTTRPDTIYGVTALVLAPENTLLDDLLTGLHHDDVLDYRKETMSKTSVERQQNAKEKTGVDSGLKAIHPLTSEEIPVWYADYVLPDYATGSVMVVPAHDQRDYEFAIKYGFSIIHVIDPQKIKDIIGHYFPVITPVTSSDDDMNKIMDGVHKEAWEKIKSGEFGYSGKGILMNSGQFDGLTHLEAKDEIISFLEEKGLGKRKTTYKLRDWSVSRQRYRGSPIPVYYDNKGYPQLVPEEDLPVLLPLDVENYKPQGKSPLEKHPTFPVYETKQGNKFRRECDTLDTFMCSSFYFLRFPDVDNKDELIGRDLAKKILPVDFYSGGKEHTVGHLLYSRFIHKFLFDQGYVPEPEPFKKLIHQGMILGPDGRKMSKRRGNVIDPLEVIDLYGSDAVRMYIMFMGPYDQDKVWNDNALKGVKKFLDRVERLLPSDQTQWESAEYQTMSKDKKLKAIQQVLSAYHTAVIGIGNDLDKLKFNTAVSKLMILVNSIYEYGVATKEVLEGLTLLLAPFATKLAEIFWKRLGHDDDVHFVAWPVGDETKIFAGLINLPIQVNGKIRGSIEVASGLNQDEVFALASEVENVKKYIADKSIKKLIYVEDKILNIIVG